MFQFAKVAAIAAKTKVEPMFRKKLTATEKLHLNTLQFNSTKSENIGGSVGAMLPYLRNIFRAAARTLSPPNESTGINLSFSHCSLCLSFM